MDAGRIRALLKKAYGNPSEPDFSFVTRALEQRPYVVVEERLGGTFLLEEDTDPNDDVSFGYVLKRDGMHFVLRLSMVGPFAVLLSVASSGEVVFVGEHANGKLESVIIETVEAAGVSLLSRSQLETPVGLALYNTAPNNVCLYQALFVDTDRLPWM